MSIWILASHISRLIDKHHYTTHYSDIRTLILGDSHTKYINEKVLQQSENLSFPGESYKESYYKLKYFNEFNHLRNVIIGASYHNFTYLAENKIVNDYHSINRISSIVNLYELFKSTNNYSEFLNVSSKSFLPHLHPFWFSKHTIDRCTKDLLIDKNIQYKRKAQLKKMNNGEIDCNSFVKRRIKHHYKFKGKSNYASEMSEKYFDDIVEYCQKHQLNLVIVNMPLHPCYRNRVPKFNKKNLSIVFHKFEHFANVKIIDYSNIFDDKKHLFKDPDHVIEYGGYLVSEDLLQYMDE